MVFVVISNFFHLCFILFLVSRFPRIEIRIIVRLPLIGLTEHIIASVSISTDLFLSTPVLFEPFLLTHLVSLTSSCLVTSCMILLTLLPLLFAIISRKDVTSYLIFRSSDGSSSVIVTSATCWPVFWSTVGRSVTTISRISFTESARYSEIFLFSLADDVSKSR